MFKNYFKIAFRNLLRHKELSFINIFGLSIGMAAAVLILLWVQNEFSYDNYHHNAEKIYRISFSSNDKTQKWNGSPLLFADAAKEEVPDIKQIARFLPLTWNSPVLNINNEFYKEKNAVFVDASWFSLFHYDFIEGSSLAFAQSPNSIILTRSLAKKYYGNGNAIGKIIRIDSINYQVQAVVKDNPSNSSFQFTLFLPLSHLLANSKTGNNEDSWKSFGYETFFSVAKNAGTEKITSKLNEIFKRNSNIKDADVYLLPLRELHFETGISDQVIIHGNKKITLIFALLGTLLLAIACINYVNLSTARAGLRAKEISVKKIIGASRRVLFRQFMAESFLTGLAALLFALLIIRLSLPFFNSFTEKQFVFSLASLQVWEVLGGTFFATILLTGIYPALLLSSFKPLSILKGNNILKIKNNSLRKVLVVSQFSIATFLIICTIVIFKQLNFIQHQDEGYNRSQIFSVAMPSTWFNNHKEINKQEYIKTFRQELLKETGIVNATFTSGSIINISMSMSGIVNWEGRDPNFNPMVSVMSVDSDFHKIFHFDLKEGRWFHSETGNEKHSYILNETALSNFGIQKPYIGKRFEFAGDTGAIIVIVKDFHYRSYHEKIAPIVIVNDPAWASNLFIQTFPSQIPRSIKAAEATWKKFFPQEPFDYSFLDEAFDQLYRSDIKTSTLIGLFACIAIIISCLGLFGLAAFITAQRIKEIGLRKILGASVENLVALLSKEFLKLVLIAGLVAFPVAWWAMNKWLQGFAYRINISWWIFIVAGLIAIIDCINYSKLPGNKSGNCKPSEEFKN